MVYDNPLIFSAMTSILKDHKHLNSIYPANVRRRFASLDPSFNNSWLDQLQTTAEHYEMIPLASIFGGASGY
jgi:hypothetical protein